MTLRSFFAVDKPTFPPPHLSDPTGGVHSTQGFGEEILYILCRVTLVGVLLGYERGAGRRRSLDKFISPPWSLSRSLVRVIFIFFILLHSFHLAFSSRHILFRPLNSPAASSVEWSPSPWSLRNLISPTSPQLVTSKHWICHREVLRSSSPSTSTPTSWAPIAIKSSRGNWSEHTGVTVRILKEWLLHWHWHIKVTSKAWIKHRHIKITAVAHIVWIRHVVPIITETSESKVIFNVDHAKYPTSSGMSPPSVIDRYTVGIVIAFKILTSPSSTSSSDWYTVRIFIITKVWDSPSSTSPSDWYTVGVIIV